jgi:glucuronosyltransferase
LQDLENWISGARHGLIYFNLGSMLRTSTMAEDKRLAFLESFAQLPHRVLMKWEEEGIPEIPANVKLTTWSPQNDVLRKGQKAFAKEINGSELFYIFFFIKK